MYYDEIINEELIDDPAPTDDDEEFECNVKDREYYEALIKGTKLFELDKETQYTAYKREQYKLIEYLYSYEMATSKKYEPYGLEITEIAIQCISNFQPEKGEFIKYFNRSWSKEFSHIKGDAALERKYRGIKISEKERRAIKNYFVYSKTYEKSCELGYSMEHKYEYLAKSMDLPIEIIREIAEMESIEVIGDSNSNKDGEGFSLWENTDGGFSVETRQEDSEAIEEHLKKVDLVFESLQERQKPILSDLLTIALVSFLTEEDEIRYSFVSNEILEKWFKNQELPTQRDIAVKYNRNEASISRTRGMFLEKLKNRGVK